MFAPTSIDWRRLSGIYRVGGLAILMVIPASGIGVSREFEAVALVKLLVNCKEFDGKVIYTTGVAAVGFEDQSLCLNSELAGVDALSCIWLETAKVPGPAPKGIRNHALISIQGEVSCASKGHLGGYAGTMWDLDFVVDAKSGRLLWQRPKPSP